MGVWRREGRGTGRGEEGAGGGGERGRVELTSLCSRLVCRITNLMSQHVEKR